MEGQGEESAKPLKYKLPYSLKRLEAAFVPWYTQFHKSQNRRTEKGKKKPNGYKRWMDRWPEPGEVSQLVSGLPSTEEVKNWWGKERIPTTFQVISFLLIIFNLKAFFLSQLFNSKKKRTAQECYSLTAVSEANGMPSLKTKSTHLHFVTAEMCNQ